MHFHPDTYIPGFLFLNPTERKQIYDYVMFIIAGSVMEE